MNSSCWTHLSMKSSQEASYLSVGGCDTMKSSWCNVLAISGVVGHVINDE